MRYKKFDQDSIYIAFFLSALFRIVSLDNMLLHSCLC